MKRTSARASAGRALSLSVVYARGGKTNEEEALAEKRCVEVGGINAARDVAEWVYAQRYEPNMLETRGQS